MILKHAILLAVLLSAVPALAQQDRHSDHAAHLGASVMPFDLGRSTHVFTPMADGGSQDVVSKDGDPAQVVLIRGHLRREAQAFAHGDYADPAAIHGRAMPGLAELRTGAAEVRVLFEELPDGARLRFTTRNRGLVVALHRWFAAQVADHGTDALMVR